MPPTFLFLLIPLLIGTATLLEEGQIGGDANDEIVLDEDETLDLTNIVETVPETTETIGGVDVDLTQEVEFVAVNNDVIVLKNTAEPSISVEIFDQTKIKAPAAWDGILTPPITVPVTGTVDSAFVAPTSGILFGSPDVILVFDKAVTIILTGTTGQTAYKLPGQTSWTLIDTCTGIFSNPDDPPANGECSISDSTDTKILTFHFTEFTGLSSIPSTPDTPSTPSGGSSGGGRTGERPSTSSPGQVLEPGERDGPVKIPEWFRLVVFWWAEGKITEEEMNNALNWLIANM